MSDAAEERFEGTGGFQIFMRSWRPATAPRGVVVIGHGFNSHSGEYQWTAAALVGLPVFMLGHSAGGVVACTYTLDHQRELAGLVCESFAFQVPAPDFALAVFKGLSHVAAEMVRADERLKRDFATIKIPVLILHGTADKATRPSGSQQFNDTAGSTDKTLELYDGHYHDLLNDLGNEQVMSDIIGWLAGHT